MQPPAERSRNLGVFDGFRALALTGVVIFHLLGASGWLTVGRDDFFARAAWALLGNSIDFFFVLSGFLLFLPVLRRGGEFGSVSDFYWRRLARIQPEYWLSLVVVLAMIVLIPVGFQPPIPSLGSVVIHVLDLQTAARMIDPDFLVGFWINASVWMIPVIVGLYLVLPLVSGFFYRHIWWGLGLAMGVTVAWKLFIANFHDMLQLVATGDFTDLQLQTIAGDQTPAYAYSFALGMTAAVLYLRAIRNPDSTWVRRGVPAGALIAVVAYLLWSIPYFEAAQQSTTGLDGGSRARLLVWENLAGSTARAMLVLAVTLGPLWLQRVFDNPAAKWTAKQSYGIYLIHLPIAFYASQLLSLNDDGGPLNFLIWSAVVLPLGFAYAWMSRTWVGEPAVRRVRAYLRRRSRSRPPQELRYLDAARDREQ